MRGAVSIGNTVTEIVPADSNWKLVTVYNNSDATIFVGWTNEPTALTAANGVPVPAAAVFRIPSVQEGGGKRAAVQGIVAAGAKDLRFVAE